MKFGYIFMFFGIAVFSFLNCRNSAVGMIKEIGTNSCYYPKRFIILKSRMKKLFKIKDRVIQWCNLGIRNPGKISA